MSSPPKVPSFPSKPMLPYFQIIEPHNSILSPKNDNDNKAARNPDIERISTMFRHHTLDIVPTYDPGSTVKVLKQCRKKHSKKHNEVGVHKNLHRKSRPTDSDFTYSNILDETKIDSDDFNSHVQTQAQIHTEKSSKKSLRHTNEKLKQENENMYSKLKDIERLLYEKDQQLGLMCQQMGKTGFDCQTCDEFKKINEECLCELENLRKDNQLLKSTIKQSCQNCLNFENKLQYYKLDNDRLNNSNKNLTEDLGMLKNVVYRLNVQLERYQEKLRKNYKHHILNPELEPEEPQEHQVPVSWGKVNTHTLAPLLDAYQDAIVEKDDLIKQYQKELDHCSGKLKDILHENEMLHKKILEDEDKNVKIGNNQEEVNREIYLLREKNETLGKKCSTLNEKIQDLLKMYEQKVEAMTKEYEQLRKENQLSRSEFSNLQGKHQIILESLNVQKRENENFVPITVHNSSLADARRAYDGLKAEYETERIKMYQQIKSLEKHKFEFEKEIISLRTERNELQINHKTLDKVVNKLKINNDQQQHQIISLQVSRDSCRRQLQKAFAFSRELVREQEHLLTQLAEKSRESETLQHLHTTGSEMSNKMESIKSQFKTLQQEAMQSLDSVEQKMHEQDSHINTIRKTFESEVAVLNQMLTEKDDLIQKLSTEAQEKKNSKPAYLMYKDLHNK